MMLKKSGMVILCGMILTFLPGCMSISATGLIGTPTATDVTDLATNSVLRTAWILKRKAEQFSAFVRESGLAQESGMEILSRLFRNEGPSTHYWQKIDKTVEAEQFRVLLADIEMATVLLSEVNAVGKDYSGAVVGTTGAEAVEDKSAFAEMLGELEHVVIGARQARRSMDIPMRKLELASEQAERLSEQIFRFEAELETAHRFLRSGQFG